MTWFHRDREWPRYPVLKFWDWRHKCLGLLGQSRTIQKIQLSGSWTGESQPDSLSRDLAKRVGWSQAQHTPGRACSAHDTLAECIARATCPITRHDIARTRPGGRAYATAP